MTFSNHVSASPEIQLLRQYFIKTLLDSSVCDALSISEIEQDPATVPSFPRPKFSLRVSQVTTTRKPNHRGVLEITTRLRYDVGKLREFRCAMPMHREQSLRDTIARYCAPSETRKGLWEPLCLSSFAIAKELRRGELHTFSFAITKDRNTRSSHKTQV